MASGFSNCRRSPEFRISEREVAVVRVRVCECALASCVMCKEHSMCFLRIFSYLDFFITPNKIITLNTFTPTWNKRN